MARPMSEPVSIGFQRGYEVDRWRVIGNFVLAIPQLFVSNALNALAGVLTVIAFFAVLFTKAVPESIHNMIVMCRRYQWRVGTYALFMRNEYPPFEFSAVATDPGGDPAMLSIERPKELQRWAPLYKWFLAIPHYVVLVFLGIGAAFAVVAAWFAVLFTGKWPEGLRDYVVKVMRWGTRVSAYVGVLRDEYPPFALD